MYDELIASLEVCSSNSEECTGCEYSRPDPSDPCYVRYCGIIEEAAKAIKTLQSELRNCRNELCYRCGDYKLRHQGACDGCRYKD